MGFGSDSGSQNERDEDDEEEYDDVGGGNRFLGFMFGNVDNSGDLDVDYLDEDAKEHLTALADKLGPSLTDIDLSVKSPQSSTDVVEQDYDEKAEDAVDYEDIEEQYEGPEVQAANEEDYLLPKKDYFSADVSLSTLKPTTSVFDDENYDEEIEQDCEVVDNDVDVHMGPLSIKQVKFPVVDSIGEKSYEDDHQNDRLDTENFVVEAEEFQDVVFDKSSIPLPVLCMEDGMAILRFSEIFGIHKPLKKREKRDRRYSVPKDTYKSMNVSDIVEEDEEAFLKGAGQGFPSLKRADLYDISLSNDSESESTKFGAMQGASSMALHDDEQRKDAYLIAEPIKKDLTVGPNFAWQSPLCPKFYLLDQQDWEGGIVWDSSSVKSDNSVESCEISGPDLEASVDSETELEPGPQNLRLLPQVETDEKNHDVFLHSSPVLLEPFGSRTGPSTFTFPERRYHPQLLRLVSRIEVDDSNDTDGRSDKVFEKQFHQSNAVRDFIKLTSQNRDMLEGSWSDRIMWEADSPVGKPKLIFDLQDEQMLFEIMDDKDGKHVRLHAGAMIMTCLVKSSNGDSLELPGHGGQSGWRHVSNDKNYSNRKTSQQMKSNSKKRTTQAIKIYHSQPALTLQTMKLKLSNKKVANFHRPKALCYPHDNEVAVQEQGKLPNQGPMKIIIKSLGGKGSKVHVDAEETISSVKTKASKKLDFKSSETVKMFYVGKELEDHKSLAAQNVQPNSLLHLVRTKIHLLPRAQKLPGENKSVRPPGAFKKKSDLSVKDGHVFLMEYCEERPLLLSNVGMGAKLCTYYQKSDPGDQTASLLRSANSNLGHVISLNPADKSPFVGDIKAGCSQLSIETNMYRAPVFSHKVPSTDYLLVRSAKGKFSIRRIDRLDVLGQQEPLMEVMSPGTKNLQNYMINRLIVNMCREFRAAEKRQSVPFIRADELPSKFPYLSETFLRKKLREYANLLRGSNGQWSWVKKRNFRIYSEDELRNMVKPEEVCAYESMQAGLYRLKHLGITKTHPSAISSVMSRLPDEAIALAAASHIERELQITPWNLSSNFVSCTQGKENIERLEITGVGDPSGRGLGFSYVHATPKASVSGATVKKKSAAGQGGSTVNGTDADLRRLSMEAAREVLLKFNVPNELIAKQTRWHRIAMIRKLSSEQASSGVKVDPTTITTISKYARGHRMSFLQLQQQTREKCQEIWDRQIQNLSSFDGDENESDSEGNNSDLDSFAGDLENLLDAEECEEGVEGYLESKQDKTDGGKGLKMRRRPSLAQTEEEIEDEAVEAAELCRLLMDDDETERKRKKKTRVLIEEVGFGQGSRTTFSFDNADRVKQIISSVQTDGSYISKENAIGDSKVENLLKKNKSGKVKSMKEKDIANMDLMNKKLKIAGDGVKMFKEKKSARESFICGACGQLGHMRTNKNCPKYGEDLETHLETPDMEKASGKSTSPNPSSQSQPKALTKKFIPKSATKIALVEASQGENIGLNSKIVPLKFKCGPTDKLPDKLALGVALSSDRFVTSDPETGKSSVKVNKIIISNKVKAEDKLVESRKAPILIRPPSDRDKTPVESDRGQVESHKPSVAKRPLTETEREQPHKKIIFKRPKEIIDVDQISQDGGIDIDHRKTKRIVELSSFEKHRKQENVHLVDQASKKKAKNDRRRREEQERQRNEERQREERARSLREEEMRMFEEKNRLAEIRRYEAVIKREREEERQKEKKKKKKKMPEIRDDYIEDPRKRRFEKRMSERDHSAKRRPIVELGRYGSDSAPTAKCRRLGLGEVGLSNILMKIVERLRERNDVSYLFLKPVSKKEAPDYLEIIERPMDLSTIREKVRKMEYKRRQQFRFDVWQIAYNAHKYNDGRNPSIPPLADQLLELCDYMLNERDDSLTQAEAGIEPREI